MASRLRAGFLPQSGSSSRTLRRARCGRALPNLEALAFLVFHRQSVLGSDVHLLPGAEAELQLLQQGGQEEEDFPPADGLPDASPLPQAESQHFVALRPVYLSPCSVEEPLGAEGGGVFPKLPAAKRKHT